MNIINFFHAVNDIIFQYIFFQAVSDIIFNIIQGVHKVLHTFKILISQKPHLVETLDFRQ